MEPEGDDNTHQNLNRCEIINHSQFPSTSMQDSSFIIPILPAELIIEILTRVPVKSLMKFRCVSKFWLALISRPEFVKTHLSVSADNKECTYHRLMMKLGRANNNLKNCSLSSLLYNEYVIEASDLNYPVENSGVSFRIVGSVNGLICLVGGTKDLFLWNPTIKKYKKLSHSIRKLTNNTNFIYGFGYDESNDDYKVVCIVANYQQRSFSIVEVKNYSLKSDSWRNVDVIEDRLRSGNSGTFLNSKLHWTTSCGLGEYNGRGTLSIVSIDMADEKWGKVEAPCIGVEDVGFKLGVLGNNLSVLCNNIDLTSINVWVMKEYGVKESWTKMSIKCPDDYFLYPSCHMSNKDEILLVFGASVMTEENQDDTPTVIKKIYNPKNNSIKYAEVTIYGTSLSKEIYIESLVCPLSHNQRELSNNDGCRSSDERQLCNY